MSEAGFFLVDRGVFGHDLFEGETYSRRDAWLWLLSKAAWRPYTINGGRVRVALDRGQLCHSIRYMAEAWGWGRNKVDKFLTELVSHGAIACEVGAKVGTQQTLITICNYDAYQLHTHPTGDSQGTVRGQSGDNREDLKTIETTSSPPTAETAKSDPKPILFDPDWALDEIWIAAAVESGVRRDAVAPEWENFRDYQLVHGQHVPGEDHGSFDWLATWRRWCKNPLRLIKESARMRAAPQGGSPGGLTGQAARLEKLRQQALEEEGLTDEPATRDDYLPAPDRNTAAFDRRGQAADREVPWVSGSGREPSAEILRLAGGGGYRSRESSNLKRQRPYRTGS